MKMMQKEIASNTNQTKKLKVLNRSSNIDHYSNKEHRIKFNSIENNVNSDLLENFDEELIDSITSSNNYLNLQIAVITPPLESETLFSKNNFLQDSLNNNSNWDNSFSNTAESSNSPSFLTNLPDSPDSSTTANFKSKKCFYSSNLTTDSISLFEGSTLNNIATHSHIHGSHRFHPFQNGVGGSTNLNSSQTQNTSQSNSISVGNTENPSFDQMPETDCYYSSAASNMLDYRLNSTAYIGELSPTKCNDYQVNGYASSYYSSMQAYPLNTHHSNNGQNNSSLTSIQSAANFYNNPYGMLSQGYMTGAYNNSVSQSNNLNGLSNTENNHVLQLSQQNHVQNNNSLLEDVSQLTNIQNYHNGLSGSSDYNAAANYSQLAAVAAQQAAQPYGSSAIQQQTQHSTHPHSSEHIQHPSQMLLNTTGSIVQQTLQQQIQHQHHTRAQHHRSQASAQQQLSHQQQMNSNYYYSHSNPQTTTESAPHVQTQQTAASLLHQHQQHNQHQQHQQQSSQQNQHYHHSQTNHNSHLNQQVQNNATLSASRLVATEINQVQVLPTAGTTCSTSSTHPCNNITSSSNSISNNMVTTNKKTAIPSTNDITINTSTANNSNIISPSVSTNSNNSGKLVDLNNDNTSHASMPNSPAQINKASPNSLKNNQLIISNNSHNSSENNEQIIDANNKFISNTPSVLIESLSDLELAHGQKSNSTAQQLILSGQQTQPISPLNLINCNNSLSSINSNCTDDIITYQNINNSITLTDLNAHSHYQSQNLLTLAQSPNSQPKCSPKNDLLPSGLKKMKTSRGRGRKQPNSSPEIESSLKRVFIWDLDETLIILDSLIKGTFAIDNQKEPQTAERLGKSLQKIVHCVADTHFYYNHYEDCSQYHIDEVTLEDTESNLTLNNSEEYNERNILSSTINRSGTNIDCMRNLQLRYQRIKDSYLRYRNNVETLIDQCGLNNFTKENWNLLKEELNSLTSGWINYAQECLKLIHQHPKFISILVTDTQLVVGLSKILVFGFGPMFPIENVYSSVKVGKEQCFQRIMERYGKKCTYVVIGDGKDEEIAAKSLNMPFWRMNNLSAMANLHVVLKQDMI